MFPLRLCAARGRPRPQSSTQSPAYLSHWSWVESQQQSLGGAFMSASKARCLFMRYTQPPFNQVFLFLCAYASQYPTTVCLSFKSACLSVHMHLLRPNVL